MTDPAKRLYEGLFLLDQQAAAADLNGCVEFLQKVFDHAEAEVLVLKKWSESKLAYVIHGQRRGTYLLAYFRAHGSKIATIERDCNLSERVIRHMVLHAEHIGEVELELAKRDDTVATETALRGDPPGGGPRIEVEAAASTDPAPAGA